MNLFRFVRAVFIVCLFVTWSPGDARADGFDKQHPFVNSLGMQFVPVQIPGGSPVLFSVWKTRVKDFEAFANETGYDATKDMHSLNSKGNGDQNIGNWKSPGFAQTELHPVCGVSHIDAIAFCAWLSKKENRHYRLPSDHEWSCAASDGDKEKDADGPRQNQRRTDTYPWGNNKWPPPKKSGNFAGEECTGATILPQNFLVIPGYRDDFMFTSPVGSFDPNPLGLYDLGGNLCEWCGDFMDNDPQRRERRNRVLRGSSWADSSRVCLLCSFRRHDVPDTRGNIYGFRVVLDE